MLLHRERRLREQEQEQGNEGIVISQNYLLDERPKYGETLSSLKPQLAETARRNSSKSKLRNQEGQVFVHGRCFDA